MNITYAKYTQIPPSTENSGINIRIDGGELIAVPLSEDNRHYNEIMRQVNAGNLTISDADPFE